MGNIDIVGSIVNRNIKDSMSLEDLVNFIKKPSYEHKVNVDFARSLERGSDEYAEFKRNKIPCAILNFNHSKGYVRGNTVSKPTGYLYIDVDKNLDVDLSSPYISAYWRSLSGTGYSIVVAVDGLTKNNYKEATKNVSAFLDLPLDKSAISIDRVTCISYDPDAYYNPQALVYKITDDVLKSASQSSTYTSLLSLMGSVPSYTFSQEIRVTTIDDLYEGIDFNAEPIYDLGSKRGMYYDIGFALGGVKEGSRNSTMYSVVMQLRGMNTWCQSKQMLEFVLWVNRKAFFPMLKYEEVKKIVDNCYKVPISKVRLKWPKFRRFLYNKDYDLSNKNKRSLMMKEINSKRSEMTVRAIMSAINYWDPKEGKITLAKLAEITQLSLDTLKKRSGQFKEIIKEKNLGFKNKK